MQSQSEVWQTFIENKLDMIMSQNSWLSHVQQGVQYMQLCRARSFYLLILGVEAGKMLYLNSLPDSYGGALCKILLNPHYGMLYHCSAHIQH